MADEDNGGGDRVRRMDLNLYLGLPRRRPESDLGSDLALNSLSEMSSSNTPSYQSISQTPTQIGAYQSISQTPTQIGEITEGPFYDPSPTPPYEPEVPPFLEEAIDHEAPNDDDDLFGHHPPYLPSYLQPSPTAQDSTEAMVIEDTSNAHTHHVEYVPYSPSSYVPTPLAIVDDELHVQEVNPHHLPYIPVPPTNLVIDDIPSFEGMGFRPYGEMMRNNRSFPQESPQREELRFQGFRRWIDRRTRRARRYRSSGGPYRADSDSSEFSSGAVHGLNGSRRVSEEELAVRNNGVAQKASEEGVSKEAKEEEEGKKEQSNGVANFDCNVCLDVAKEPVVTSCGHLFCWPCLYQWLHLHCDHKECPVCKGEVTEENVTPIYGRGSSGKEVEKGVEEGNLGLKIPPRPHGVRLESLRQRMQRPILRRSRGEGFAPWRLVMEEEMHNQAEASQRITRLMSAQRLRRDSDRGGSESSSSATEMSGGYSLLDRIHQLESRGNPPALARRGPDFWRRLAFYSLPSSDRLAIAADLSSVVGRMANGGNMSDASASTSVNPQGEGPSNVQQQAREAAGVANQASASSTIAVIQGDSSLPVDAPAEPSSVGSSPTLRRRRRNTVSGSLDVDGVHHACKRRRLN